MKSKLLLFLITLLLPLWVTAQTQQGYVKSLGRPEKQGEALEGVTLRVKGCHNTVVSDPNGDFSLLLTDLKNGDAYSLQQVKKNGYELNEIDFIGRKLAFSDKVPLTIVMVSSEQLRADKLRIENNAYKTAEKNYKAKYDQLEKQLADNEITKEQYQAAMNDLQDKFEKYQSLIDGLATHYAHTDYDMLDEKDREINLCIEKGDLERADSLIHTLFDPIDVLKRNMDALADIEQQIGQARGIITQANANMEAVLKQQEKDAEYLYQLFTIATARFDNEKAEFYIDTRAELDTTNGKWQHEAADYYIHQNQFHKAQFYYNRAIRVYREKAQEDPETYEPYLADALNNMGVSYHSIMFYYPDAAEPCEKALSEAVNILRRLADNDLLIYGTVLGGAITSLGNFYLGQKDLKKAKTNFEEAVKLQRQLIKEDDSDWETYYGLALALSNLGHVYDLMEDYKKGEKHLTESLETLRQLVQDKHEECEDDLAHVLGVLSGHYHDTKEEAKSQAAFEESVALYRKLAKDNPQRYEPQLADRLYGRGITLLDKYYIQLSFGIPLDDADRQAIQGPLAMLEEAKDLYGRYIAEPLYRSLYIDALKYLYLFHLIINEPQKLNQIVEEYCQNLAESKDPNIGAQEFIKLVQSESPETAENDLFTAKSLMIMSENYRKSALYDESEAKGLEGLKMFRKIAEVDPTHEIEVAMALNNFSFVYDDTHQNDKREACLTEALDICRRFAKTDPDILAKVLANLGSLYQDTERFDESEKMYEECVRIRRQLVKADRKANMSALASTLGKWGNLYYSAKDYKKCEPLYQEAYEIYQQLYKDKPSVYKPELAAMKYALANTYWYTNRVIESVTFCIEAYELFLQAAQEGAKSYEYERGILKYNCEELAPWLVDEAADFNDEGKYEESETYYKKALVIYRLLGKEDPTQYEPKIAGTLNGLAILYANAKQFSESEAAFKESFELYQRLAKANSAKYESLVTQGQNNLEVLASQLIKATSHNKEMHRYAENKTLLSQAVGIYRYLEQNTSSKYETKIAAALGSYAYNCLFTQDWKEAEQTAREALTIDSTQLWINANLAAGLLFQGKYSEAESICIQYKDNLKNGLPSGLDDLNAAGLIPKKHLAEVEHIKELLKNQ